MRYYIKKYLRACKINQYSCNNLLQNVKVLILQLRINDDMMYFNDCFVGIIYGKKKNDLRGLLVLFKSLFTV